MKLFVILIFELTLWVNVSNNDSKLFYFIVLHNGTRIPFFIVKTKKANETQ